MYKLVQAAAKGQQPAQEELYFWAYLWPRLTESLWGEDGYLSPLINAPGFVEAIELRTLLALVVLGPQPEPPDQPAYRKAGVMATQQFHDHLMMLARTLEKELSGKL
jgi:hypothetical protein